MSTVAFLPLYTPTCSSIIRRDLTKTRTLRFHPSILRKSSNGSTLTCRAAPSSITEFDLYDLLGIDSCSDQSQIKLAYRSLQKRCHPDIAGPDGHDMAIILNEAYAILCDPNKRLAYDKEQAKIADFKGFTGRPIYSVWLGSESEQRAIFVDEVKCIGCLKCALLAQKTFAIESVFGRARVVAQWADDEHKIQEAIDSCPVNCISMVERSNLAALEFLMSKQPRGNVRVGSGNTGGIRVSNIFVEVDKFQSRFDEEMGKVSRQSSKEADLQREARMSAVQAIRSVSNWLYWQSPSSANGASSRTDTSLIHIAHKLPGPSIDKLRDAAARKQVRESTRSNQKMPLNSRYPEEYWVPSTYALPSSTRRSASNRSASARAPAEPSRVEEENDRNYGSYEDEHSPIRWGFPVVTALIAVAIVRLHGVESTPELKEHIAGSLALEIVNSPWSQGILAAATWYMIGMAIIELVAIFGNRKR